MLIVSFCQYYKRDLFNFNCKRRLATLKHQKENLKTRKYEKDINILKMDLYVARRRGGEGTRSKEHGASPQTMNKLKSARDVLNLRYLLLTQNRI